MATLFEQFDDLRVTAGDLTRPSEFTLTGIVRNEMYFLPDFLAHYRSLGVDRFVFVDDASTDGTSDFLASQPDTITLRSQWRFGDRAGNVKPELGQGSRFRMIVVWRNLLLAKFGMDRWSLHVDVDEFLDLPPGMGLADVTALADREGARVVWSVMPDVYPETVDELLEMGHQARLDLSREWFFDGTRHLKLVGTGKPKRVYSGSRARLMSEFGLIEGGGAHLAHIRKILGLGPPPYNSIRKPALIKWAADTVMPSSHDINLTGSPSILLPLRHFKFSGAAGPRIEWALKSGGYSGGSKQYKDLERLLVAIKKSGSSFLCAKSVVTGSFQDYVRTGNARLPSRTEP